MSWTPSSIEKTKKPLEAHVPRLVIKVESDIEPPTSLFYPPPPTLPPPSLPLPAQSLQLQSQPQSGPQLTKFSPPTFRRQARPGRMTPKERVVSKGPLKEKVNYPPHEQQQSEHNRQKLLEMELYPSDGVGSYPRSIPFKGSKEDFLRKTGRNRFDVFEYRFTAPNVKGEKKWWWVMWDYYNGLVRVHDFFDCCKPGKTEPGNAVREKVNPGLASVCHNITGGNLHAQGGNKPGYWIPYEAAKALAAKFCYRIRYALTIIFGDSFPEQCLPEHHPEFGKYQIDAKIITACRQKSSTQLGTEQRRLHAMQHQHQHQQQQTPSIIPNTVAVGSGIPSSCFASTSSISSSSSSSSAIVPTTYPPVRRRKSHSPPPPPPPHSASSNSQTYAQYHLRTSTCTPPPPPPPPRELSPPPSQSSSAKRYFDPVRGTWTDRNSPQRRRHVDENSIANGGSPPNQDAEQYRDTITRPSTNATFYPNNISKQKLEKEKEKERSLPPITPLLHLPHPHPRQEGGATVGSYYQPSEPTPKRAKYTRVSAPPRFVLGTFSRGQRVCRSDSFSLSPTSTSSCSRGRGGGVKVETHEEHVLAVEAAGNLMKLRLDEFNSSVGGAGNGGRKRRQSR
ncbi:hypothetical protein L873DRAFT_129082 [Choiromyces venosus 120613-1]|uniref:HTH APSES-type domain-containing protein n=1 Tax=Choiromyces venosus 120613-1 TaxID=1336337 RepID=A0A3N4J3R2_9PEZI|nr:hypothetical protein L873DRAFT_129082 [Choiromyces venosus 120613-1]